jgi:hypothetical protein
MKKVRALKNLWYDIRISPKFLAIVAEEGLVIMIRIFTTTLLAGTCAFAQTSAAPPAQPLSRVPSLQQPAPPSFNPDNVAPNAPVVTIQGVCAKATASA